MILVVACGNHLRRDDGAGLLVAEKLEQLYLARRLKVQRIAVQQLTPELAEIIAGAEVAAVVFVDTRIITPRGSKQKIQIKELYLGNPSPSSGHHLDPETLMLYACHLYGKKLRAWKVSVPGSDFGHGEGLSETARQVIIATFDLVAAKVLDFSCNICGQRKD